jgi:hypothetical protein
VQIPANGMNHCEAQDAHAYIVDEMEHAHPQKSGGWGHTLAQTGRAHALRQRWISGQREHSNVYRRFSRTTLLHCKSRPSHTPVGAAQ